VWGALEAGYDGALGLGEGSAKEAGKTTRHRHGRTDGQGLGGGYEFAHRGAKIGGGEGGVKP